MNDLDGFLGRLVRHLEQARVPYMVAGSLASTFHGRPRATQDVDVVVELGIASLKRLLDSFPDEDYYTSFEAGREAVRFQRQFNIVDIQTGWKADLIVKKRRPFSRREFERRERATILGVEVWVASVEDTILTKLEWATHGQSERQLRDVAGMVDLKGAVLDAAYMEEWLDDLGVRDAWDRARAMQG